MRARCNRRGNLRLRTAVRVQQISLPAARPCDDARRVDGLAGHLGDAASGFPRKAAGSGDDWVHEHSGHLLWLCRGQRAHIPASATGQGVEAIIPRLEDRRITTVLAGNSAQDLEMECCLS